MSRVKTTNTDHSYLRAAERCGWGKKKARDMMKAASRYGISAGNLPPGPERDFVSRKQYGSKRKEAKEKITQKVVHKGGTYCVHVTAFCNTLCNTN